jgi:hypothetical protein
MRFSPCMSSIDRFVLIVGILAKKSIVEMFFL